MALHRRTLLLIAVAATTLAAALGLLLTTGSGDGPSSAEAATKVVRISIKDYAYSKPKITIKVGTKVKWTNRDEMRHNATGSKKGGPKGPLLDKGKSYTWTAKRAGTYRYHCAPHPFMKGTIVVKR